MNLPWLTFSSTIVHTHTHTRSQGERTAAKEEESRFDRKLSRGRAFFSPSKFHWKSNGTSQDPAEQRKRVARRSESGAVAFKPKKSKRNNGMDQVFFLFFFLNHLWHVCLLDAKICRSGFGCCKLLFKRKHEMLQE
jgi:hypothetical protein